MAEALVGGAFLSATLKVLFDRLASREVLDFIRGRKIDDNLLKNLKINLLAFNAVLNDAEEKQITNPAVKEWLDDLKDAVYDADDLLDLIATEALRRKLEAGSQNYRTHVREFFSAINPFDEGIRSKVKMVITNMESIAKQIDLLGLKVGVGRKPLLSLPTTSLVIESSVYGREDDKEKIIKLLLSDDASDNVSCVIPIVGMGGLGKTTLAQLLYNDEQVNEYFDLKAWVCVSKDLDIFKITKTVLEAVHSPTCVIYDLDLLQVKLRESLTGKKFLLVLDDIWNESYDDWDKLRTPFMAGAKGSKIIVTTRNASVASTMRSVPDYYLQQLSYEASWSLFIQHAFDNVNANPHPDLEVIGKKIVEKCKGLPLAVKTLGGLLRSKLDAKEWNDILESKIWDLPDDRSNILVALRLSYHYLPTHLKQCFAYCSIFPKDHEFSEKNLILLWMAEGIVQQPKSMKRMEDVGYEYFQELLSRSFFQHSSGDKSSFIMHDLINDLAQFVSGEFCYRLEGDKSREISGKVRHFSYSRGQYECDYLSKSMKCDSYGKFGPICKIKSLRTFLPLNPPLSSTTFCLSNKVPHHLLSKLSYLRVLSLSCYENITELPDSICNLKQLRYLDLSQTAIKRLSKAVCTLYNLQTLMLIDCHSLTELPEDIGRLTNLRHLAISGTNLTQMPMQMSGLKSLQTLSDFFVGRHNSSRVGQLREFRHLRETLSISKLQNVVNANDALEANLKDMENLHTLLLEWDSNNGESKNDQRDVLDKLRPSTNLEGLTIKYYCSTSFPNWLGDYSFSNMAVVCLSDCIYCLSLPPLGQLPFLHKLSIVRINLVKRVGLEFYGSGSSSIKPFQRLKILEFEGMSEWEEWSCCGGGGEGGEFPSLEELRIEKCPRLRGVLPNHLPALRILLISDCQQLMATIPSGMTSIYDLKLTGCQEVVLHSGVDLTSLQVLGISEFPYITCLPSSNQVDQQSEKIPLPSMLQFLKISKCDALVSLPEGMFHSSTRLRHLRIADCPSLKSFPRSTVPATLKILHIENCKKLELLVPEAEEMMHNYYASLEDLSIIRSCDSLKCFPLGLFPKLRFLKISDCMNLESLWISNALHQDLTSLTALYIRSCPKLVSFPKGGLPTPNLTHLYIKSCVNLKSMPERMHALLPSLQHLNIVECPKLESFPQGGLPPNLKHLAVYGCPKLMARRMEWVLQTLVCLKDLVISGDEDMESFPEEWMLPANLTNLFICFIPNLKYVDKRGLQHLTSLENLYVYGCPKLRCLPKEGLPASLCLLDIQRSPLLEQWCQRKRRKDWHRIARIPCILINGELIS